MYSASKNSTAYWLDVVQNLVMTDRRKTLRTSTEIPLVLLAFHDMLGKCSLKAIRTQLQTKMAPKGRTHLLPL